MDILTTFVVLVPSVLSLCVSGIYAFIALKKAKEPPKDDVWETTTKILCSQNSNSVYGDDFAELYEELKWFKDNGCSLHGEHTIRGAIEKSKVKQSQQSEIDSTLR